MRLPTIAAILFLTLQPIVFHRRALISKTTYLPFDLPGFHTPLASAVVEALREHRWPWWDPYIYAGYPIHADIQAQIYYPLAWPAFLASAVGTDYRIFYWLEWQTALHISLAGLFTAWLLRRFGCGWWASIFGATVYQLGCFFSAQAQHLGAVCCAAWMPLAWLSVAELGKRFTARWFAALAAALAMSLLAGFPAMSVIAFGSTAAVAMALWFSGRARATVLAWLIAAIGVSLVLSAAQLVPSALWSAHAVSSQRWRWNDGGGISPWALLTTFWPDRFHTLTAHLYTEPFEITFMYLYNGLAALALFLAAPFLKSKSPARLFAALTVVFAVVMLGTAIPGYEFLFHRLPRFIRGASYVEFATSAFTLAMALAAGFTLHHLTQGKRVWIAAFIALGTSVELTRTSSNRFINATQGNWKTVDSSRTLFGSEETLNQLRSWLNETTPPWRTDTAQREYRLVGPAQVLRLPTLGGDNSFAPLRMIAYRKLFCQGAEWERFYTVTDPASPLLDAGSVGFLLHVGDNIDDEKMRQAGWDRIPWRVAPPIHVFRNREPMPRYYLVSRVRRAGSQQEAVDLLKTVDPRREAIVEGALDTGAGAGPVTVVAYRADRVELKTSANAPSYLVVAESWAPDWRARIDGKASPIYPTDVAFQGLPVPAGEHHVTFEYVPKPAYLAAGVSVFGWVALAAWVIAAARAPSRD